MVCSDENCFPGNKHAPSVERKYAFFAGLSVASVLVPVHPSVQGLTHQLGIPAPLFFIVLWFPILLRLVLEGSVKRSALISVLPFAGYAAWLIMTSAYSTALGLENWGNSVRGIGIILPCTIVAALMAAREPGSASRVIILCGLVAFFHYLFLLLIGEAKGEGGAGFGAIAVIDEVQNYQATSYYIGICGVYLLATYSVGQKGILFLIVGLTVILFTMSTVGARASVIGLLFVSLIVFATHRFGKIFIAFLLVSMAVILYHYTLLASAPLNHDEISAVFPVFERFSDLLGDNDPSHRVRLFSSALDLWLDSPSTLLFGSGLGSFPVATGLIDEKGWYPHNFVLETLAEGGLVSLLFLAVPTIVLMRSLVSILRHRNFTNTFFIYFAIYSIVAFMFMGGINTVWIPFFPWIIAVIMNRRYE